MLRSTYSTVAVAISFSAAVSLLSANQQQNANSRRFLFTYQATVTGLKPNQTAKIWLPVPRSGEAQQIEIVKKELPTEGQIGREPKYDNEVLFLETKANEQGKIPLAITFQVLRHEVKSQLKGKERENLDLFLKADSLVPVGGKCLELIQGKKVPQEPLQAARMLYDIVHGHMDYKKEGKGWGRGDSEWACDNGYGNCTDFHSLFISLARAQKIAAKFEIGFSLPVQRGKGEIGGYHCWALFQPEGQGWIPVDISEGKRNPQLKDYYFGNLTEDRLTFSVGRDLTLVPRQEGPPVNFLIYPYVEVNGLPYAQDLVQLRFTFEDVKPESK